MTKEYQIIHTPGAFGNFIGYLVDCHRSNVLLPTPFVRSGSSHNRHHDQTDSLDLVIPGKWDEYKQYSTTKTTIGCVWETRYFSYILHAVYSRTNMGQYGECGVRFAERDFYNFVTTHKAEQRMFDNIKQLKQLFNIEVSQKKPHVPRNVLRMFFWFAFFEQENNIVSKTNQLIKNLNDIKLLNVEQIIDYQTLKKFFIDEFGCDIDFREVHDQFIRMNHSLTDFNRANAIIESVKTNIDMEIQQLSVIGEAKVFYELEKYYFDIPFFNHLSFPKSTGDILRYVAHYPDFMKQPNKLYQQHFERFPPPGSK